MSRIRNCVCKTINKIAKQQVHLAKRHSEPLLHNQPIFSGHQPQLNNLRVVRYLEVVLLARLEPLPLPNPLRAHLEPLGNNSPPPAPVLGQMSLVAEVLRSGSNNSNNHLRLVPLVNLSNNLNKQPPALAPESSVVRVHSGSQSLVQDLEAPSVNQVGVCS